MIATEDRRRINRLNALHSTGPRTAEGKEASSCNAVTHGLFTRHVLARGEDADQLAALRAETLTALEPRDAVELALVERYICESWRLQRAVEYETHLLDEMVELCDERMERLHRSMARTERSVYRALKEFNQQQALRRQRVGKLVNVDASEHCERATVPTMLVSIDQVRQDQREHPEWFLTPDGDFEDDVPINQPWYHHDREQALRRHPSTSSGCPESIEGQASDFRPDGVDCEMGAVDCERSEATTPNAPDAGQRESDETKPSAFAKAMADKPRVAAPFDELRVP